jgi:hypothetical protein
MYSKLFASILDSSVWLEPMPTRIVWLTLLAAKDQEGFARFASVDNLARRAVVSVEQAANAVAKLEAPDPNSSNPKHEGRRIERIPGGWVVLNAKLYDDMVRRADELRLNRERVKRHREKQPTKPPEHPKPVTADPAEASVLAHYLTRHPKRRPGPKDKGAIRRALATYSAAELCLAIDGNANDPWHAERGKHELTYVLRDNGQIDNFRARSVLPAPKQNGKPTTAEQMTTAMKNVFSGPKT